MSNLPIGIFDSGVGGISVLTQIQALMPTENIIYVADSGHSPYGCKSQQYVQQRSIAIAQFLINQGVKVIVVACNTATASSISLLRQNFSLPILGMEPGLKPAVQHTKSGIVGVLATSGTLSSEKYDFLKGAFGKNVKIISQPCPGLVEMIEHANVDTPVIAVLLAKYITVLLDAGADTIVLGCTHYPLVIKKIESFVDGRATIIETGLAVANHLQSRLRENNMSSAQASLGTVSFWASGDQQIVNRSCRYYLPSIDIIQTLPI